MAFASHDSIASRALRRVGTTLCGRYRIVRLIGVGGMGVVYAGVHRNGHAVAIKILHERLSADAEMDRLFRREALLANKIEHSGVVPVIDDDVSEDGCAFLVMPLLAGETVRARADRREGKLPVEEVLSIAGGVLRTLDAAHARKIVHRDIKPDNLFVTDRGEVRVLDFGIARLFETEDPASATRSGRAIGTPSFMAPEQALGRWRDVDGRTDLWALGATMFALLTGRLVHAAASASEMLILAGTRPAPPLARELPTASPELALVVDRALQFDRNERWPNASAMHSALAAASASTLGTQLETLPRLEVVIPAAGAHLEVTQPPAALSEAFGSLVVPGHDQHPAPNPETSRTTGRAAARTNRETGRALRWAGVLGLGAVLVTAGGALLTRRASPRGSEGQAAPAASSAAASAPPPPSLNPQALVHYTAGIQAWDGGEFDVASEEFEAATQLEPTFAAAHLRCVLGTYWLNDSSREHYWQAVRYRSQLEPVDAVLLEAYEPMLHEVPDIADSIRRLQDATTRFPQNLFGLDVLEILQVQAEHLDDALATIGRMDAASPSTPVALGEKGILAALRGDTATAKEALNECIRKAPRASACWQTLLRIELGNGDCAEAEELARHAIASQTDATSFGPMLAAAIFGAGGSMEAARDALAGTAAAALQPKDEANLFILQGKAKDALAALHLWSAAEQKNRYAKAHMWPAYRTGLLLVELGRSKEAVAVADDYLRNKAAWLPGDYADDWINLIRVQYAAGAIGRKEYAAKRDEWLRSEEKRSGGLFARALQWMKAYAFAVQTREDAEDALAALDRFGDLPHGPLRSSDQEDGIGYTYLLAGKPVEALPHLRQAAKACSALDWPIEQTWSYRHLGMALEVTGDRQAACDAYAVVLGRWGTMRTQTSTFAASRRAALQCK